MTTAFDADQYRAHRATFDTTGIPDRVLHWVRRDGSWRPAVTVTISSAPVIATPSRRIWARTLPGHARQSDGLRYACANPCDQSSAEGFRNRIAPLRDWEIESAAVDAFELAEMGLRQSDHAQDVRHHLETLESQIIVTDEVPVVEVWDYETSAWDSDFTDTHLASVPTGRDGWRKTAKLGRRRFAGLHRSDAVFTVLAGTMRPDDVGAVAHCVAACDPGTVRRWLRDRHLDALLRIAENTLVSQPTRTLAEALRSTLLLSARPRYAYTIENEQVRAGTWYPATLAEHQAWGAICTMAREQIRSTRAERKTATKAALRLKDTALDPTLAKAVGAAESKLARARKSNRSEKVLLALQVDLAAKRTLLASARKTAGIIGMVAAREDAASAAQLAQDAAWQASQASTPREMASA